MVGFLYYIINYVLSFILLLFFFDSLNWILFFSSRSFYAKKKETYETSCEMQVRITGKEGKAQKQIFVLCCFPLQWL